MFAVLADALSKVTYNVLTVDVPVRMCGNILELPNVSAPAVVPESFLALEVHARTPEVSRTYTKLLPDVEFVAPPAVVLPPRTLYLMPNPMLLSIQSMASIGAMSSSAPSKNKYGLNTSPPMVLVVA
jgi:hypothetical protein